MREAAEALAREEAAKRKVAEALAREEVAKREAAEREAAEMRRRIAELEQRQNGK